MKKNTNFLAKNMVKANKLLLEKAEKDYKDQESQQNILNIPTGNPKKSKNPNFQNPELNSKLQLEQSILDKRKSSFISQISRRSHQSEQQKQLKKQYENNQKLLDFQDKNDDDKGPLTTIPFKEFIDFKNKRASILEKEKAHNLQNITEYFSELVSADETQDQYIDDEFQSNLNSIAYNMENLSQPVNQVYTQLEFKKIEYVVEEAHNMKFCGIDEGQDFYIGEIIQGKLQNLPFLNALAIVASSPQLFKKLCCLEKDDQQLLDEAQENELKIKEKQGYYFRFHKNKSQKYTVLIDTIIPVLTLPNKKLVPAFSRQENDNQFWVSLIEKAYAKLHGSYQRLEELDLRTCINDLTGLESDIVNFYNKEHINIENLKKTLKLVKTNRKWALGFLRQGQLQQQKQIRTLKNRVYLFQDIDKNNEKIKIKCPWSNAPKIRDDEQTNNQYFIINYEEFFQLFDTLVLIKDFPDEYKGTKFDIKLEPSFGLPSANNQKFMQNQQYLFDVNDARQDTNFQIFLKGTQGIQKLRNFIIGFSVLEIGQKDLKSTVYNKQNLRIQAKSDEFSGGIFACGQGTLSKGRYALIPFTNIKQEKGTYLSLEFYHDSSSVNSIKYYEKIARQTVLEDAQKDMSQTLRILKDTSKRNDAVMFDLKPISQEKNNQFVQDYLILIPCILKEYLLLNQNQTLLALKQENSGKDNQKQQQNQQEANLDPVLDNYQEHILVQTLLGQDQDEVQIEAEEEVVNQQIVDFVQQETEGVYDFNHYGIGDKGVEALLPSLIKEHEILEIQLSGNNITDKGILNLCYELEKSHHLELECLDLSDNEISQQGANTLITFIGRMPNLYEVDIEGNDDFPELQREKIKTFLMKRKNKLNIE